MRSKVSDGIMPRAQEKDKKPLLTREEWRAERALCREKQCGDNVKRAAKMHAARLKTETDGAKSLPAAQAGSFRGMLGLALLEMARFFL